MADRTLLIHRDQFTPAQRRRVEAVNLVVALFPSAIPGRTQSEIATWIATGRWEG